MDQEGTAGETVSGNQVECVFAKKVLITLKGLLFIMLFIMLYVVFTISGDGSSTKEPGIDPGLTEKPDRATEEQGPTTASISQGEKGTYERALHSAS